MFFGVDVDSGEALPGLDEGAENLYVSFHLDLPCIVILSGVNGLARESVTESKDPVFARA